MNYQKGLPDFICQIIKDKNIEFFDYDYYAWPQTFSSTSGPRGGVGGQTMSTFTIEAYSFDSEKTIYVCAGMYHFAQERFEPMKYIKAHWARIPSENK